MRSSAPALADPTVLLHHVDPILDVARRATDGDAFLTEVSDAIGRVIPYDAQTWFGSDPATLFASAPVLIDSIADGHCDSYWAREFLVDDVLLFKDLAIAPTPAGTMRKATDGLPARSARYRGFMQPQGFGDELRLTLRIGSSVWGLGDMFRAEDAEPFSPAEVQLMASLSTPRRHPAIDHAPRPLGASDRRWRHRSHRLQHGGRTAVAQSAR